MSESELADAAQLSSLADETPEGRSIVVLAKQKYGIRGREVAEHEAHFIPFTAQTRMSGVDLDGRRVRKGATESVTEFVRERGGKVPPQLDRDHRPHLAHRRHAAGGGRRRPRARRGASEGCRQRRHARALRSSCATWAFAPS